MGEINVEPSMEEILSSIKRIIAEEGDGPVRPVRKSARMSPQPTPRADPQPFGHDEILELSDPYRSADDDAGYAFDRARQPDPIPMQKPTDPILSPQTAEASRGSLEALSRLVVKPTNPGSDSLEAMVREMVRPMLREWLDAKLPEIVETMVAREIERISGRR